ncbi:restriction endonuclease subunit S [Intestinimonas butyriciproducens]|uniref:Type I restriction enzyme S subunit n=1 Tax=Intestinimonas butyriciproducens TaxID=1297617 RepID=A0A2U1BIS5_9FIRM|nr:restriction endonuclease subunit S [Intestinimonas butyriciproducens]MCR1906861.1 restriction endonuclease subunit S [Intestinimonas butyriciproducens]PVY48579.1 type I restriction enzyme S subunit [Intestinimonas butyriciproducens]QBB65050.1 Type I restriction-modification system, specificity subunit S [Intestinimonas butyriciproducens]
MKAADLRKAILQAAVQGKLVSQDKNDEPASELLKRIQAEKATLIKDGKLKKEKPLSPITEDEIPYDLPDGWVWCRLGEVTLFVATGPFGSMLHKSDYVKSGIPLVNPANMQNGSIVPSERMLVDETTRERLSSYVLHEGDIVVARRGDLGRCAVVTQSEDGWICGTGSFFLRIASSMFLPFFLLFFETSLCREQLMGGSVGTTMSNLNHAILKSIYFPLPPIKLQQRIVSKVNELMALCDELEATEKELDALESHFFDYLPKSILQAAVQGKLVPQDKNDEPASELLKRIQDEKDALIKEGKLKKEKPLPPITEDEIPYDLPDGWVWCRAIDVCSYIQRGKSPTYSETKTYPVVSQKCVQWKGMDMSKARFIAPETVSKYEESRKLTTGDLLWNSTGQGTLGRIAIYDERLNPYKYAVADSHVTVLRPLQVLSKYMYYWFAGPEVQSTIEERATGSTKQIELATSTIMSYIFPLPPLEEQQRIVTKVDELMALCDELKRVADQPINHDNVIPFPAEPKENIEPIAMAARGKVEGISDQAKQAIEDLFGEDE